MGHGFDPWSGKIPWRQKWQPIPVFLPGELHEAMCAPGDHEVAEIQTWFSEGTTTTVLISLTSIHDNNNLDFL